MEEATTSDHVIRLVNAADTVLGNIEKWRDHPTTNKEVLDECLRSEVELKNAIEVVRSFGI